MIKRLDGCQEVWEKDRIRERKNGDIIEQRGEPWIEEGSERDNQT